MSESTDSSAESTPTEPPSTSDLSLPTPASPLAANADAQVATATPDSVSGLASPSADQGLAAVSGTPSSTLAASASTNTPAAVPARTGPKGKTRSPFGGWLLLIPTLGIYYLFWYFNINRELRDYDSSIKVKPGWAVVSLFIPVVGLISIYNTGSRIRQAQATAGGPAEASGLLGLIASLFFVLDIPYYSSQLNKVWQHA
jgi:hypothetical protein